MRPIPLHMQERVMDMTPPSALNSRPSCPRKGSTRCSNGIFAIKAPYPITMPRTCFALPPDQQSSPLLSVVPNTDLAEQTSALERPKRFDQMDPICLAQIFECLISVAHHVISPQTLAPSRRMDALRLTPCPINAPRVSSTSRVDRTGKYRRAGESAPRTLCQGARGNLRRTTCSERAARFQTRTGVPACRPDRAPGRR